MKKNTILLSLLTVNETIKNKNKKKFKINVYTNLQYKLKTKFLTNIHYI